MDAAASSTEDAEEVAVEKLPPLEQATTDKDCKVIRLAAAVSVLEGFEEQWVNVPLVAALDVVAGENADDLTASNSAGVRRRWGDMAIPDQVSQLDEDDVVVFEDHSPSPPLRRLPRQAERKDRKRSRKWSDCEICLGCCRMIKPDVWLSR